MWIYMTERTINLLIPEIHLPSPLYEKYQFIMDEVIRMYPKKNLQTINYIIQQLEIQLVSDLTNYKMNICETKLHLR